MLISIINGWDEGHFKSVAAKGLRGIEFCINGYCDSAEVLAKKEDIKKYSEKYGVKVVSVGRWGMKRLDENGEIIPEALAHDKNLIDLASFTGCPVYNVGANRCEKLSYYDNCAAAIKYFGTLTDYASDKNVKIAVYNCDWENFVYEEKTWSVVLGALPSLGIKYDASHCVHRGSDYLYELYRWGERIYHVHIKGTLAVNGCCVDNPPAGLDQIHWGEVMDLLYCANYDGALSIEPHSTEWQGKKGQWGIDFTIKYLSRFIMPEDYECEDDVYSP